MNVGGVPRVCVKCGAVDDRHYHGAGCSDCGASSFSMRPLGEYGQPAKVQPFDLLPDRRGYSIAVSSDRQTAGRTVAPEPMRQAARLDARTPAPEHRNRGPERDAQANQREEAGTNSDAQARRLAQAHPAV